MTQYRSRNTGIMSSNMMSGAIHWLTVINDWLKAGGIIVGALLSSVADWILGAFTLSLLFTNIGMTKMPSWLLGLVFSGAAWGLQLFLWHLILSGKTSELFGSRTKWPKIILFIMVVFAKIADDIVDMMGVYYWTIGNPFQQLLDPTVYKIFLIAFGFLVWVVVGFSEAFISLSIWLLDGEQPSSNSYRSDYRQPPSSPKPVTAPKPAAATQPAPTTNARPLYTQPTYHPGDTNLPAMNTNSVDAHFVSLRTPKPPNKSN